MVFTVQTERESQVGCLRLRFPIFFFYLFFTWALVLRFHCYLLSFSISFTFDGWLCYPNRVFASRIFFADKRHVAPNRNLVNFAGLNKVLRSEVFVSEDRKLRAVHLILDLKPLSNKF